MSDEAKKKKAPPRRKRRFKVLAVGVFFLFMWCSFSVSINFLPVRPIEKLEQARATWEAKKLDDYVMRLHVGNFCNVVSLRFTIENNHVAKVEEPFVDGFQRGFKPVPLDSEKSKRGWYRCSSGGFYPPTTDFTMENLFNIASEQLKDVPAPPSLGICDSINIHHSQLAMSYHETEGYITSMVSTCMTERQFQLGLGFLCTPTMGECSYGLGDVTIEPISTPEK